MGPAEDGHPAAAVAPLIDFDGAVAKVCSTWNTATTSRPFSFLSTSRPRTRFLWQLHTTDAVHELVRDNIDESPLFNGQISGIGPRYCPSLEDKVMRFPDRDRHQLFPRARGRSTSTRST